MTLVIDPKVALLKGVDPVQFCVFIMIQIMEGASLVGGALFSGNWLSQEQSSINQ